MEQKINDDKTLFGFWVYLMTDLIIFAVLFAAFVVLRNNNYGGITIARIFNPPFVLIETLVLLTSSFICGLGMLYASEKNKDKTLMLFGSTFILGLVFLIMELSEFSHLIAEGNSFTKSAFLSSYFTLVGTHGLHIFSGLVWMAIMIFKVSKSGLTHGNVRKLTLLSMFWHFLDIVWIFIFTVVYLFGGIL